MSPEETADQSKNNNDDTVNLHADSNKRFYE